MLVDSGRSGTGVVPFETGLSLSFFVPEVAGTARPFEGLTSDVTIGLSLILLVGGGGGGGVPIMPNSSSRSSSSSSTGAGGWPPFVCSLILGFNVFFSFG